VVLLLQQAALALDKTHAAGIVHRDLKPDNLFLTVTDDGSPRLKVLDFGIAKVMEGSGKKTSTRVMGTPVYMSPEQIRGDAAIDGRADIYALGHIAYTLLTGQAYWDDEAETASDFLLLTAVVAGARESPEERARRHGASLPEGFDSWFAQATAVDPEERFETATAMVRALGETIGAAPSSRDRSSLSKSAPPLPADTGESFARTGVVASAVAPSARARETVIPVSAAPMGAPGPSRRPIAVAGLAMACAGVVAVLTVNVLGAGHEGGAPRNSGPQDPSPTAAGLASVPSPVVEAEAPRGDVMSAPTPVVEPTMGETTKPPVRADATQQPSKPLPPATAGASSTAAAKPSAAPPKPAVPAQPTKRTMD
jgi:serine/threonine-protein kinase